MKITPRSLLAAFLLSASGALAAGKATNIVIVVMDGLRPDSVVEADMPNLSRLAKEGTFFVRHHPVYISSTEVNGTALATGATPARSGIIANVEYRPEIDPLFPIGTDDEWAISAVDRGGRSKWLATDTLPEIVRRAGRRTAVAGTKGVAILWDRLRADRTIESATVFGGEAIPSAVRDILIERIGPPPIARDRRYFVNAAQDQWTTSALTGTLWSGSIPTLSVLWLSEPDYSQHGTGPGSPQSRAALKASDDCLGRLLAALDAAGKRADTDIFVVSDHGFSTVAQGVDIMSDLSRQGLRVGGGFLEKPSRGTVVMVGLGGSVAFYVVDRDRPTLEKLTSYLQTTGYAGVIFTRDGLPGTFKLSEVGMDSPESPDVVMSMRWSGDAPRAGALPGLLLNSSTDYSPGMGMHGSLSRYDMNNTLIAAGPDFKAGHRSEIPSANSDVAPTILHLLGLPVPATMDGRVLEEALSASTAPAPRVETQVLQTSTPIGARSWQQYLKVSKVGRQTYYDEGNAGPPPAAR